MNNTELMEMMKKVNVTLKPYYKVEKNVENVLTGRLENFKKAVKDINVSLRENGSNLETAIIKAAAENFTGYAEGIKALNVINLEAVNISKLSGILDMKATVIIISEEIYQTEKTEFTTDENGDKGWKTVTGENGNPATEWCDDVYNCYMEINLKAKKIGDVWNVENGAVDTCVNSCICSKVVEE